MIQKLSQFQCIINGFLNIFISPHTSLILEPFKDLKFFETTYDKRQNVFEMIYKSHYTGLCLVRKMTPIAGPVLGGKRSGPAEQST